MFAAFSIILASSASGAETKLVLPKSTSSYHFVLENLERENGIANALTAVRDYGVDGGKCLLVVTSKSCYALTAAHCFQRILSAKGNVTWQVLSDVKKPIQIGFVKDGVLPYDLDLETSFRFKILKGGQVSRYTENGQVKTLTASQQRIFGLQDQIDRYNSKQGPETSPATGIEISLMSPTAKVIAIGRGFSNRTISIKDFEQPASDRRGDESAGGVMSDSDTFYKFVRESRALDLADYALLKLPEENCKCATAGELNENENVVVAGFSHDAVATAPMVAASLTSELSAANVPFSYGTQCYALGSQVELFTRDLNLLGKIIVHTSVGWQLRQTDTMYRSMITNLKDQIIVTNARAAPGASGGAMFNSTGQLVGITTMTMQHASGQKSYGIRLSEIKDQLRKTVGEQVFSDAFRCDQ